MKTTPEETKPVGLRMVSNSFASGVAVYKGKTYKVPGEVSLDDAVELASAGRGQLLGPKAPAAKPADKDKDK
jgi:hypothetical protein